MNIHSTIGHTYIPLVRSQVESPSLPAALAAIDREEAFPPVFTTAENQDSLRLIPSGKQTGPLLRKLPSPPSLKLDTAEAERLETPEANTVNKSAIKRIGLKVYSILSFAPSISTIFVKCSVAKNIIPMPCLIADIFVSAVQAISATKSSVLQNKWIKRLQPDLPYVDKFKIDTEFNRFIERIKSSPENEEKLREEMNRWGVYPEKCGLSPSSSSELKAKFHDKKFLKSIYPDFAAKIRSIESVNKSLESSKAAYLQKIEEERDEFSRFISGLDGSLEEIKEQLLKRGVDLTSVPLGSRIQSTEEFKEKVNNEDLKNALFNLLLQQYVNHQLTQAALIKNPLKNLCIEKQKAEKTFFNFNCAEAWINAGITLASSVALVAMKVMIIAGVISIPAIASTGVGIGAIVAVALVAGVGLYLLYRYKPHTFKQLVTGASAFLQIKKISKVYYKFRLKREEKKLLETRPDTKEHESIVKKAQEFQVKLEKADAESKALKNRIARAGWNDFKIRCNLNNNQNAKDGDIAKKMARALTELYDSGQVGTEIDLELKKQVGIDLEKVFRSAPSDSHGDKRDAVEAELIKFFAKSPEKMVKFINRQFKLGFEAA